MRSPLWKKNWTIEEARPIVERELFNNKVINALFVMYTRFGFPPEMTIEELEDRGYEFDKDITLNGFNERFKEHQELSRRANVNVFVSPLSSCKR
jgi:alanyl-tRNA synthetase